MAKFCKLKIIGVLDIDIEQKERIHTVLSFLFIRDNSFSETVCPLRDFLACKYYMLCAQEELEKNQIEF